MFSELGFKQATHTVNLNIVVALKVKYFDLVFTTVKLHFL
jgi:hypothetical protein